MSVSATGVAFVPLFTPVPPNVSEPPKLVIPPVPLRVIVCFVVFCTPAYMAMLKGEPETPEMVP